MPKKWVTIKLPEKLINIIDRLVEDNYLGYTNRADFAKDAIRRRIEDIEKSRGKGYEKK